MTVAAASAQQGGNIGWNPGGAWVHLDGSLANPSVAFAVAAGTIALGVLSILRFGRREAGRRLRFFAKGAAYWVLFGAMPFLQLILAGALARVIDPELKNARSIGFTHRSGSWLLTWAVSLAIAMWARARRRAERSAKM